MLPVFTKNDLAATIWLNYGSAAQSANDTKTAIKAYDAFLKLAPDDANAPQVKLDREAAQVDNRGLDAVDGNAMIDIETTPDGATLVSVSEPLDYGLVADLAEVLASDSVREAHHIVIELAAPGSMDESAVGVLVRSARDTRLRGGRLTLCGADDRVRDALERIGVARLVQLADDASSALASGRAA